MPRLERPHRCFTRQIVSSPLHVQRAAPAEEEEDVAPLVVVAPLKFHVHASSPTTSAHSTSRGRSRGAAAGTFHDVSFSARGASAHGAALKAVRQVPAHRAGRADAAIARRRSA